MMKKLFALLLVSFSLNAFSQLTVAKDSLYKEHYTSEEDVAIYNTHASQIPTDSIVWKVYSIVTTAGWVNDASICDATSCYDISVDYNGYKIPDNKPKPLDVHFFNNSLTGEGTVKLLIWNYNDSINSFKIVTYHTKVIEEEVSEINSISDLNISIYPNPTTNFVHINNVNTKSISSIGLYNVIGKQVLNLSSISTYNTLDVEFLNPGVYIMKILDGNQNTIYTKNLIKK